MTYGPMSDGVSDGGGGRLIKVGVGMIANNHRSRLRFSNVRASSCRIRVSGEL